MEWYEEVYRNASAAYDEQPFVKGASGEVDFIEAEIAGDKNISILDVACGTGRHSIELASRGYSVKGVDLSESQLERARKKAHAAGVKIDFEKMDARTLPFQERFGLVLNICEGAFALMANDVEDFAILKGIARSLQPGGKLILTTLNALYSIKTRANFSQRHFDLATFRCTYTLEGVDDQGNLKKLAAVERHYTPSEIHWRLNQLGFEDIEIYACDLGKFSKQRPISDNDMEMLVVARKATKA